jgi:hypothetical protein
VSAARRAAATRLMTERGYSQRRACGKLYRLYRWSLDFVADTLSFGRRFRIYGKQPAIEPLPHCRQGRLLWLTGRIGVWIEKDSLHLKAFAFAQLKCPEAETLRFIVRCLCIENERPFRWLSRAIPFSAQALPRHKL